MVNKIKEILDKQVSKINPDEEEFLAIKGKTKEFIKELTNKINKKKIAAEVFVGGSIAKKTLIKKEEYDVDIFVRFDKKYKDNEISEILDKLSGGKRIHGSRDYFQVKEGNLTFEIVPTIKIKNPREARNVTDLSYFHVNYIKKKTKENPGLGKQIMLGKAFCYANRCYGAESYIKGFSGYALELLVSYYGSFLKFLKSVKDKERIILDPGKHYKNKNEILLELNESKLNSPIVFVDPTFKYRNALAALSKETFAKFKHAASGFLNNPNESFFEKQNIEERLKKKHKNITIIQSYTNRQKGDIGGSKLRKFHNYLIYRLKKYFEIKIAEFEYSEESNSAKNYFVLQEKKELIIEGPPITHVDNLNKFKKKHKNCFIRKGKAYCKEESKNITSFVAELKKHRILKEMDVISLKLL
jgi:tRNA nucleotidyltransferase (CCA-adding enzyme)